MQIYFRRSPKGVCFVAVRVGNSARDVGPGEDRSLGTLSSNAADVGGARAAVGGVDGQASLVGACDLAGPYGRRRIEAQAHDPLTLASEPQP